MPTVDEFLYEVHREMKRRNLPEMDKQTLVEAYKRFQHPVVQRMMQGGQLTPVGVVTEVEHGLRGLRGSVPNARDSRIAGEAVPGALADSNFINPRFNSTVPIPNALGPAVMPNQRGTGTATINPLLDRQNLLRQRLQRRLPGSY
jgi:hypothetical protein